jgi:hypothetical protein
MNERSRELSLLLFENQESFKLVYIGQPENQFMPVTEDKIRFGRQAVHYL